VKSPQEGKSKGTVANQRVSQVKRKKKIEEKRQGRAAKKTTRHSLDEKLRGRKGGGATPITTLGKKRACA